MSTSSDSVTSSANNGIRCYCLRPAKMERAWTRLNPGRRFYTCRGRRVGNGFVDCKFFRWYDLEEPHGWQNLALLEARDIINRQKEEIAALRYKVTTLTREYENNNNSNGCDQCERLKREVLILEERSKVLRNVLLASSVGFVVVIGGLMAMRL